LAWAAAFACAFWAATFTVLYIALAALCAFTASGALGTFATCLATFGAVATTTTASTTAASAIGAAAITAFAALTRLFVFYRRLGFVVSVTAAEQASEPAPQSARFSFGGFGCRLGATRVCRCRGRFGRRSRLGLMRRSRRIGQHTFDDGCLLVGGLL
jgi:hypothetical protein